MFTINAVDARELQKEGVPQAALLQQAIHRCEAAILDVAGKCQSSVTVTVSRLLPSSLKVLVDELSAAGFTVEQKTSLSQVQTLVINWGEGDGAKA